ncbi:MAG: hypothetical protein AAB307_04305 [Deltaproteobacteria bacterium]
MKKPDMHRGVVMLTAALSLFAAPFGALYAGDESLSYTGEVPPVKRTALSWGRDPFILPSARQTSGPALKLMAIFYNGDNPSAIIDNLIVYRGSEIKGQKVIDIELTHVILHSDYGKTRLDLAGITEMRDAVK